MRFYWGVLVFLCKFCNFSDSFSIIKHYKSLSPAGHINISENIYQMNGRDCETFWEKAKSRKTPGKVKKNWGKKYFARILNMKNIIHNHFLTKILFFATSGVWLSGVSATKTKLISDKPNNVNLRSRTKGNGLFYYIIRQNIGWVKR